MFLSSIQSSVAFEVFFIFCKVAIERYFSG
jgi:hypothetical protein